MHSPEGFLRIGSLARQSGLSPDTLRHYERLGILKPARRTQVGYREYDGSAVARVALVQRALDCGFTLAELADVLRKRERGEAPCRRVRELVAAKLARTEREIERMRESCEALRRTLADWDRRLAGTPRGRQARLLDHLETGPRLARRDFRVS
jgi:DNA-binding transcriptional MerR regulator